MTRTEALINEIRQRIAAGLLCSGERLPSVRRFATTMHVSPSTVVEAYERLAAEGVIRARRGSGFYVCGAHTAPLSLTESSQRQPEVDPFWVSRQSLDAAAGGTEARLWVATGRLDAAGSAAQGPAPAGTIAR